MSVLRQALAIRARPLFAMTLGALLAIAPTTSSSLAAASELTASPPRVLFKIGRQLGTATVPLTLTWPASSSPDNALASYDLQSSHDGASWLPVAQVTAPKKTVRARAPAFGVLRYRVRAVDDGGSVSGWAESAPYWLSAVQESDAEVELSPGWQHTSASSAYGGRRATTTRSGESASFTFSGRAVAWVARYGANAGEADVSIDGGSNAHVDLRRASSRPRSMVFTASWATTAERTLTITTTEAGAAVDIDAFVVLDVAHDATLVGAGDIASCTRSADEATAALAAGIPGTVFTTGDNVYPDGSAANFANCYAPSWGRLKSRTRPVLGNHELYNNPGAAPYFAYFGDAAGQPGKGWYRYDVGTWRIFALSSECSRTTCAEQLEWLQSELARTPHRCVAAMWHRPRFSTGEHGDSTRMAAAWQLLYEKGAELVLAGHDHGYQRYHPLDAAGAADPGRGLRQFVVATGGASLYDFPYSSPHVAVRDNTSHGVLRLNLGLGAYSWSFIPVPGDSFTDFGTGTCH